MAYFNCILIQIVHAENTQHVSIVFITSSCWVNDAMNGIWHITISKDHKILILEKLHFSAQTQLVHVSDHDVSVTEILLKNLHFMKTNGTKWIITNGPSPFSTGKIKVQKTIFRNIFRQQVCNDPGAAVSTSYLQAKQDGTFQVVNPYLNSQFNAVQNSQVNSAPQKNYNSRQQGESNSLNLNVSMIFWNFRVINRFLGIERININACTAAL